MRIPITMCHGLRPTSPDKPLTADHFESLIAIAADMGFTSINYDDLDAWRNRGGALPDRPIMFDFDHAVASMIDVDRIMAAYNFRGTLFIHTGAMEGNLGILRDRPYMTWQQVGELVDNGWLIGAHTMTHPNLSQLSIDDPSGEQLRAELDGCNDIIEKQLGVRPKDFAYTGTTFSTAAENEVRKRYRFGRLWIVGSAYRSDGNETRFADLVGVDAPDEADGGPPMAARYITRDYPAHRLPGVEIQGLIYEPNAFRRYLQGALG